MHDPEVNLMLPQQARRTRRSWRLPLAFVLSLLTWWGVGYWLEPRPLWEIPFQYGKPVVEPLLEDSASRWLLASDSSKDDLRCIVHQRVNEQQQRPTTLNLLILDARTGRRQSQLTIRDLSPEAFPGKRAKMLGDSLWWFNTRHLETEQRLELHCWQFTQGAEDRVVKSWSMPNHTPIHVAFAEGNCSRFMIQSTVPGELELITQAVTPLAPADEHPDP
ncbi:MAG: hypothetical protein QM703_14895 [Gemmatales bacterium]